MRKSNYNKIKIFCSSSLFIALLFSFVTHLGVLSYKVVVDKVEKKQQAPTGIKVVLKEEKPTKKKKSKSAAKNQIVNNTKKKDKEKPENSRFLGEHNQNNEKQTQARKVDKFKVAGLGAKNGVDRPARKKNAGKKQKARKKDVAKKKVTLADLAFASTEVESVDERATEMLQALGVEDGDVKESGVAANNDYIEDVPLGDMTSLNTVEYKYYGFYHRIRQKLEQYWGASLQSKAEVFYKRGGRLPANETKLTSLKIIIDNKGRIVDIHLKSTSGVKELDEAAIESFNKAGPFPNPPRGMLKNGIAEIEWGFAVRS